MQPPGPSDPYTAPGLAQPQPKQSKAPTILTILGVLFLLGGGSCVACVIWLGSGPQGGVLLANQMEPYSIAYIEEHELLNGTEKIIAYYDVTTALDGSESAILTTERLVYDVSGRTTAIPLTEIEKIDARDEGIIGDVIDVSSSSGERLRVEIAPLNDGKAFIRYLREGVARANKQPEAD